MIPLRHLEWSKMQHLSQVMITHSDSPPELTCTLSLQKGSPWEIFIKYQSQHKSQKVGLKYTSSMSCLFSHGVHRKAPRLASLCQGEQVLKEQFKGSSLPGNCIWSLSAAHFILVHSPLPLGSLETFLLYLNIFHGHLGEDALALRQDRLHALPKAVYK